MNRLLGSILLVLAALTSCSTAPPTSPPTPPPPSSIEGKVLDYIRMVADANDSISQMAIGLHKEAIITKEQTAAILDYSDKVGGFQKTSAAMVSSNRSRQEKFAAVRKQLADLRLTDLVAEFITKYESSGANSAGLAKLLKTIQALLQLIQSEIASDLLFGMTEEENRDPLAFDWIAYKQSVRPGEIRFFAPSFPLGVTK